MVCTTFCLSIHPWMVTSLLLPFGYCEYCCNEHGCINICLKPCFQFLWAYIQKWNSWIIWWFYLIIQFLKTQTHVIILYDSFYVKVTNRKLSSGDKVREVAASEWGRLRAGQKGALSGGGNVPHLDLSRGDTEYIRVHQALHSSRIVHFALCKLYLKNPQGYLTVTFLKCIWLRILKATIYLNLT